MASHLRPGASPKILQGATIASGSPLGAIAAFVLSRHADTDNILVLMESERRAEMLGAILNAFDPDCGAMVLPRADVLPYDGHDPSPAVAGRRASVLRRMAQHGRTIVIATPDAVLQRVPTPDAWADAVFAVRVGQTLDLAALRDFLARGGYDVEARVDDPGEANLTGQVVDVYPAGALGPVRIEHADGSVVALSAYDPLTQRTTGELDNVMLDVASENCVQNDTEAQASVFDYWPEALVLVHPGADVRAAAFLQSVRDAWETRRNMPAGVAQDARPLLPPDRLCLDRTAWDAVTRRSGTVLLPEAPPRAEQRVPLFATETSQGRLLRSFVAETVRARRRIVITAADPQDLRICESRLRRAGVQAVTRIASWREACEAPGGIALALRADLEAGFVAPSAGVAVISAADLLGSRVRHDAPFGARIATPLSDVEPMQVGDAVLHLGRGLGMLAGLETIEAPDSGPAEMIRMRFAGETDVLLPVHDLASVWRHGGDPDTLTLDSADGATWSRRSAMLKAEIDATARRMMALAAERRARTAPALKPPAAAYERFAAGFTFFPTADQSAAVAAVLADLASGRPMDRLVCGDVGFGKTEVALRAAAAAVLAGRQVAIVAPTTVLASQHAETFRRRFAPLGIAVGHLSRMTRPAEARDIKAKLADGTLRLVVGTHAVAGKGVGFAELGLVVVDEEHRFGVREKARLRALAQDLHLLTLSATPIPRTLRAATLGLQDLSVIATPPARRLPVRSIVRDFDATIVAAALRHEHRRGGQSIVVCPRIDDIPAMSERLRSIAPELAVRVIHGRMPAAEIDDVMIRFADGDGDILLATNIIESGLDLPRVNTILITRPDRFGLTQLHQLRGRVGRGARRAFAYFLSEPGQTKTAATEKRLAAIDDLSGLGAGFALSNRDLDLRGAGALFGEAQAGHIAIAGPELYAELLDRALRQARGEPVPDDVMPELHLGIEGRLPPDLVPDPDTRLSLHVRLARARDEEALDTIAAEIQDRFGDPPPELGALIGIARLRVRCRDLGLARVDAGPQAIALTPRAGVRHDTPKARWRRSGERLVAEVPTTADDRLTTVTELLDELALGEATGSEDPLGRAAEESPGSDEPAPRRPESLSGRTNDVASRRLSEKSE
ncbi:DEAD/DEAH box helicase [Rhodoplanes sp. SY1]|uniref:DEAD/DEAH box helicase n=1 Tax=Rhodoplanes sp. SY1 TaxID=3166646 RepID=UPI0038B54465